MDAIILAAGENVRLQASGLAPGKKPLLIRDGEVMMRRLARQARIMGASRLIIVANPANAEDIAFATHGYDPRIVLQCRPEGPQAAVDLGLELVASTRVLLLMGDNYIPNEAAQDIAKYGDLHPWMIVAKSDDDALHPIKDGRFTRAPSLDRWLGPLMFSTEEWVPGCEDWVNAFADTKFHTEHMLGIEDIGSL